jgi:hypothetical protein
MADKMRSADKMMQLFEEDPSLVERLKTEPFKVLGETAKEAKNTTTPVYIGDKSIYRIAVIVLGILAVTAAFGSIWVVYQKAIMPEVLTALGSAAVGALVGLFASPPSAVTDK